MEKKIKIAFIKYAGLSAGGTEKFLQTVATNLDKDRFEVDYYYYCDASPYVGSDYRHADTNQERLRYIKERNINLVKFKVEAKDINTYTHDWVNTDFWDVFDEKKYDIIQTGRAGHPEYPFYKIKKTPIVDSIHTLAGVDNSYNISRVMHITKWSARQWVKMRGDKKRIVLVSHPMEIKPEVGDLKKELSLEGKFVFGLHQRDDDSIFSDIPLKAYKKIENENTAFVIMGGSNLYEKQAKDLGIKNFTKLPHSGNPQDIYNFLQTLTVYSHGRKDGELNSTAMAEAMYFSLPMVSHYSSGANGHVECIGEGGNVVKSIDEYSEELKKLMVDKEYFQYRKNNSKKRFMEMYDLKSQISIISKIYEDVIKNPLPYKTRRRYFDLKTTILRTLYNKYAISVYRKVKYFLK